MCRVNGCEELAGSGGNYPDGFCIKHANMFCAERDAAHRPCCWCGRSTEVFCPFCRRPLCASCTHWSEVYGGKLVMQCGRAGCPGPLLRKRIFVATRFRARTPEGLAENIRRAVVLCRKALAAGHAPFAPHLLYPQFLNDNDAMERAAGIACGQAWLDAADELWSYPNENSEGVLADINAAASRSIPITMRPE